jgi:hypothetical protein
MLQDRLLENFGTNAKPAALLFADAQVVSAVVVAVVVDAGPRVLSGRFELIAGSAAGLAASDQPRQ